MIRKVIATILVALICLSVTVVSFGASKTDWPKKPIQIIVGANPGGGIDTAARLMGKYLEKELGQVIVVSNISGGAGSVAARQVRGSKPDGYTMLVCHEAILTNKIAGTTEFDYDGFEAGGIALKVYTTCLLSKKYTSFDKGEGKCHGWWFPYDHETRSLLASGSDLLFKKDLGEKLIHLLALLGNKRFLKTARWPSILTNLDKLL